MVLRRMNVRGRAATLTVLAICLVSLIYCCFMADLQTNAHLPGFRLADSGTTMGLENRGHDEDPTAGESCKDGRPAEGQLEAVTCPPRLPNVITMAAGRTDTSKGNMSDTRCLEERHLIFLRIAKTGSTTMTVLVWRFGASRGLKFLLPRSGWDKPLLKLTPEAFHLPRPRTFCDMMAAHVVYNYENYRPYFHPDTVYVSLIREPMTHLRSSLYYSLAGPPDIAEDNKVSAYLRNPAQYQHQDVTTHNPVAHYFGLQDQDFENTDKIRSLISEIEQKFRLILIMERMNESLLLLRRRLCWSFKDILYFLHNQNSHRPDFPVTEKDYARLRNHSAADCAIYEHFHKKLLSLISEEGPSFQEELKHFENHLRVSKEFCDTYASMTSDSVRRFEATAFSGAYSLTREDCRLMTTPGPVLHDQLRTNQAKYHYCG